MRGFAQKRINISRAKAQRREALPRFLRVCALAPLRENLFVIAALSANHE
jgi:hypothetical protein